MSSEWLKQKSPMLSHKCAQHIYLATYLNMFQRLWRLDAQGIFIDELLDYRILEKTSNKVFQVLWTEFSFVNKKNVICGIFYRRHNSPEIFQSYFEETIERLASSGKHIVIMGDFNIELLKWASSSYSHEFLSSLQSCTKFCRFWSAILHRINN